MKSFREIFHPRKRAGTPDGGCFAEKTHTEPEPEINLVPQMGAASRDGDIADQDGTYWVYAGDHYRDWYTSRINKIQLEVSTFDETGITQLVVVDGRSNGYLELGSQEFEGEGAVAEAMARGKQIRESALKYEHNQLDVGDTSPWGAIESHRVLAPGIDEATTSDHEGLFLSPQRQEAIHPSWRSQDGWYDRESTWAVPVITHHEEFDLEMLYRAHRSASNRYPEEYEAVVGKDQTKFGLDRIMAALGK